MSHRETEVAPAKPWRRRRGARRGRKRRKSADGTQPQPPSLDALVKKQFGIARLHPEQRQAMDAVRAGRDTMAVLPTGFGKSLIYQATALFDDRPTLVLSPLIALMADQEQSMRRHGVPVIRIDSSLRVGERRDNLERLARGGPLVVLTTPESLQSEAIGDALAAARPWLLCVDEAHCISEWGHDFRPAYLRIGSERGRLGDPALLALTATATPRVQDDVRSRLQLRDPVVITAPPHRPNLHLSAKVVSDDLKAEAAAKRIKRLPRPGIVYCSTTRAVDRVWAALQAQGLRGARGIPSERYHARMKRDEREAAQARYMKPSKRLVMVATNAFGMGIDKPNIRYVLHYQAPGSLEQYVQEAGRAGRDGKPATCELLFDPEDLAIQRFLLQGSRPSPKQLEKVTRALLTWHAEGRAPTGQELGLSAEAPQTVARSMAAQLEALGLVQHDDDRRYRVLVSPEELRRGTHELARRLDTLRKEDEARLQAVAAYATSEECRSVFLRRYFGEEDPPRCGVCDRCSGRAGPPRGRRRKKKKKAASQARPQGKRKRRGRRGGRRRKPSAEAST